MNLKLEFWDFNEKNMGFHLTPKSTTSGWVLGDENAIIGTYHFKFLTKQKQENFKVENEKPVELHRRFKTSSNFPYTYLDQKQQMGIYVLAQTKSTVQYGSLMKNI